MLDTARLKKELTLSCKTTQEQITNAQEHAGRENISFLHAIVSLGIADNSQIGRTLSCITELPYHPLISTKPSLHAKGLLSPPCALNWKVFPYAFNVDQNLLTIAVHDPDQIRQIKNIYKFFLMSFRLAFTIAPESEIEEALKTHFKISSSKTTEDATKDKWNQGKPLATLRQPRQTMKLQSLPEKPKPKDPPAPSKPMRSQRRRAERPAKKTEAMDLSHSLISAAALLVGAHLGENSQELADIRSRVRYCQLLGAKIGLSPQDLDKIILASWLSGLKNKRQIIKQFVTPYNLEKIIFPDADQNTQQPKETQILALVTYYQDLKERDPETCKDVNLTRRNLRLMWSSSADDQPMLEAFLQLLMDEEFLAKLDKAVGHILIVDPQEVTTSNMTTPLSNDGYDVNIASTADSAREAIANTAPDLIITDLDLPGENGITFCQTLKKDSNTAMVPVIITISQEKENLAADCLRAGADDFMVKPLNLELLFLKVNKLIKTSTSNSAKTGVSGSLDDIDFTDMIQILCAGNKSMLIVLNQEDNEGHVFVKQGEIIHATLEDDQGEDAFYKMMRWKHGQFTTKECAKFPTATIATSAISLLMEGARIADEMSDT
ncbi:MAG: response regulator [Kiritimatiellae bacterium]|nr:response regulator [Kiritimatiellia bacterium]